MYHCLENGQLMKYTQTGKFKHLEDAVKYMDDYLDDKPHNSFMFEEFKRQVIEDVTFEIIYVYETPNHLARQVSLPS